MFLVDLEEGRIIPDDEIKNGRFTEALSGMGCPRTPNICLIGPLHRSRRAFDYDDETTARRLVMHGTTETMETLLAPMAIGGKEGFGSMGNDAAL